MCLEAMEGKITFGAGLGTDAADLAAFGVDDGVGLSGIERPGDPLLRVMAGLRLLLASHRACVDDRADLPCLPQGLSERTAVAAPVGVGVLAAPRQSRAFLEHLRQLPLEGRPRNREGFMSGPVERKRRSRASGSGA